MYCVIFFFSFNMSLMANKNDWMNESYWLVKKVKKILSLLPLRKTILEVALRSLYPPLEGECGQFYLFDIPSNGIADWDKPWLSELDITSGISELHLIYDFLDFRIRKPGWPQSILILIFTFIIWLCLIRTGNYQIHEFDWLKWILTAV